MSGRSSPVNGGYESARLTVRKDLFPDVRVPKLGASSKDDLDEIETDESASGVKLETDFEQSIDEIANKKVQANGVQPPPRTRHKKHKQRSRRETKHTTLNGYLPTESKRKKHRHRTRSMNNTVQIISGKNLSLVSSSKYRDYDEEMQDAEEEQRVEEEEEDVEEVPEQEESSDDEVLKCSVKLPSVICMQRQSGKPYSHELSQLSTKKSKKDSKERRTHAITPCSGKPRSMLNICSRSKKKARKTESTTTYQSQIIDTNSIKIKIQRTSLHEPKITPVPVPVLDVSQRKSKKRRTISPVASESSGEEYDPSRGDTAAAMSVAAPKPRHPRPKTPKTRKSNTNKKKKEKTERNRISAVQNKDTGPQSPWGMSMPREVLLKIFDYVISSLGTLPSVIRLGRVCKLWHSVSCTPDLWKSVDLAQYTIEKCKTDYKLVWLLENRLSQCQSLNIAQWKVCNIGWVLTSVAECCPNLTELSVAGWSRITAEQLYEILRSLPNLQRLDLSFASETGGSGSCLTAASMARVCENFGERLTHLTLANNKFTALSQILSSVAAHCKNLEVLDISGAQATTHPAAVPLEALQKGCPKMRVFRAANAQLILASATTSQQMETNGWTQLEELSVAGEAAAERVAVGEYRLGDDALSRLVRGATRLRLLDLRGLQRLSDSGLVRVPAWDLQHLFLGGCNVTRQSNACLELICEKWSHSLLELDLSWASAARVLDDAVSALADSTTSKLRILNLCGSSVSLEPVKKVLLRCPHLEYLNLSSCRALPRGMKRSYAGKELQDLKDSFDPVKIKAKEEKDVETTTPKKGTKKTQPDSKSDTDAMETGGDLTSASDTKINSNSLNESESKSFHFQEPKSLSDVGLSEKLSSSLEFISKSSIDGKTINSKTSDLFTSKDSIDSATSVLEERRFTRDVTPKLLSPMSQSRPDSSSTPRSESKSDFGSPHFSPVPKPDSQVQNSPDVQTETIKNNSWHLGTFKSTPTYKSEASPLNRIDSSSKMKHNKMIEQCSPTTSLENTNKRSPDVQGVKQDIKNPNTWNYGNYSPMPRQDNQFSSQRSPYSAQPSPAQPSPYSTQPSPYSAQPSPYSSQPSPYSAQPSPDTSQIVKPDLPKSGAWNTGNYSPMPKHHAPFSPHPSTHTSPDPGIGMKADSLRNNPNKTPGQYSPMSRQDRLHHSPYSPRPSIDNTVYSNKKSPGVGNYSPMMRPDYHLPSPDRGPTSRTSMSGRSAELYARNVSKVPDLLHNIPLPDNSWGIEKFNQTAVTPTSTIESLVWGTPSFNAEPPSTVSGRSENVPSAPTLNTPPPRPWTELPSFESSVRRLNDNLSDPWSVGQFRVEPPHAVHNHFVEQNVNFDSLSSHHLGHQTQSLSNFLDDGFSETSRVD